MNRLKPHKEPRKIKETKEDKEARQVAEYMAKYGLNSLNEKDAATIRQILYDLAGTGLMRTGLALGGIKAEEQVKISYLSAIYNQNWIMIRQLDRIADLLKDDKSNSDL
jgi:hypothetical protein